MQNLFGIAKSSNFRFDTGSQDLGVAPNRSISDEDKALYYQQAALSIYQMDKKQWGSREQEYHENPA